MAKTKPKSLFGEKYQEILEQASVRAVLESYGFSVVKNKTICPFHTDHDPSLSITKDDKIWNCFVCGEKGNAITFVQKYEDKVLGNTKFETLDAMKKVNEICNLNVDLSMLDKKKNDNQYVHNSHTYTEKEKSLLELLDRLTKVGSYQLQSSQEDDARNYLASRGFSKELMSELNFGYIPQKQVEEWIQKKTFPLEDLLEIGFVRMDDNFNYRPFFGDRVLIPIKDERGNTVAFSGRAMKGEEPKYLHSASTELFKKNNILYNYDSAKKHSYGNAIYVVEGFMDVAGGLKIGMQNIVASMGTFLSDEQLSMIQKLDCEIVLMRDNDKAGKAAMIKEVPELLKKGFQVSVVDLSKVKERMRLNDEVESKDLWDFANAGVKEEDLSSVKKNGTEFLFENKYLTEEMSVANIKQAYDKAKEDGLINNTFDEALFQEFVYAKSDFSKKELEDILHPVPIMDKKAIDILKDNLLNRYVLANVERCIKKNANQTYLDYFTLHEDAIKNRALEIFVEDPTSYINDKMDRLDVLNLVRECIRQDMEWKKYEKVHTFRHENLFDKCYVKNASGQQARLQLTEEQKRLVIKQFEKTYSAEKRSQYDKVDEIYILNNINDYDAIVGLQEYPQSQALIEGLKGRFFMEEEMHYFSYGNIFPKEMLFAVDSKFKNAEGTGYKEILIFDNKSDILKLTKDNVVKPDALIGEEKEPEKPVLEEQKSVSENTQKTSVEQKIREFTIHRSLIEKETDKSYFVRIPNTSAKKYMYLSKKNTKQMGENDTFQSSINITATYKIFDKGGKIKENISGRELMHYWEDKTKKKKELSSQKQEDTEQKIEKKSETKTFTIHRSLLCREGDHSYFVRIPNTGAKKYMYVSKQHTMWSKSGDVLKATIETGKSYQIYSKSNEKVEKINGEQLMHYWEEKGKNLLMEKKELSSQKQEESIEQEDTKQASKSKRKLQLPFIKEPKKPETGSYVVSGKRVSQKEATYLNLKSSVDGYVLYIPSGSFYFNTWKNKVSISPKMDGRFQGQILSNIMLMKQEGKELSVIGKLSYSDLDKHIPDTPLEKSAYVTVREDDLVELQDGFYGIPIYQNRTYGYVAVSKNDLFRLDENNIVLMTTRNTEYASYKNDGEYASTVLANEINPMYQESLKGSLDIENIYNDFNERGIEYA